MALPKVYYGLHFVSGVAEYIEDRVFVSEETMKKMNATFAGKPIVVGHRSVNLDKIKEEADGYVVKSFYNKADGKCWAEFVIVSDEGHQAIANGFKLSNAYDIKRSGNGGRWNNIEYHFEVLEAEYNHLAIVEKPRYAESIILTPDEFKEYNIKKENELMQLQNSIQEKKMKFNFFKKSAIENSEEIAKAIVTLANGQEKTVEELVSIVNGYEEAEKAKKEKDEADKKNAAEEEEKKKKEEEEKKNSEEAEKKKKEEEEKEKENCGGSKKMNKLDEIKNAIETAQRTLDKEPLDLTANKVARGKKLYGSNK